VAGLPGHACLIWRDIPPGCPSLRLDAVFGRGTGEAVSRFQKARGMKTTAMVGALRRRAINALMEAEMSTGQGRVAGHTNADEVAQHLCTLQRTLYGCIP
jgi:hypothetical protein